MRWPPPRASGRPSYIEERRNVWTNADEVKAFIEEHKGGRWEVGDRFVLPDIEQSYTAVAVRPFKHRGRFKLFVDFEAQCAVEGCEEYMIATKEIHQWMASPHVVRCCDAHRGCFRTEMEDAWKTQEQREAAAAKRASKPPEEPKMPKLGRVEQTVVDVVADFALVVDRVAASDVIGKAAAALGRPAAGKRDTRRQVAARALHSLARVGHVAVEGDVVLL